MPTLHDLMTDSIDTRSRTLHAARTLPADATRGRIARTRRRRAAVAGGTSALAVGGLVTAVAVQDRAGEGEATPAASATSLETTSARIALGSGYVQGYEGWTERVDCGQDLPTGGASSEGFTLTTTASEVITLATDAPQSYVKTVLRYDGPDRAPLFIDPGDLVLVQGGEIVATLDGGYTADSTVDPLTAGDSWDGGAVINADSLGQFGLCQPFVAGDSVADTVLAAGDYQLYAIAYAHVSEDELAVMSLRDRGFALPMRLDTPLTPGSPECDDLVNEARLMGWGNTVVGCEATDTSGVELDLKAGYATVPYPAALYEGDAELAFVSQAIPVTVPRDLTWEDLGNGYFACLEVQGYLCEVVTVTVTPEPVTSSD